MDDYKFVEPKTQASVRTIYIDTDTIKELQAWREVQQKVLKGCVLISMEENPLLIKERLGHEKIQTALGTYGHLYPNSNLELPIN